LFSLRNADRSGSPILPQLRYAGGTDASAKREGQDHEKQNKQRERCGVLHMVFHSVFSYPPAASQSALSDKSRRSMNPIISRKKQVVKEFSAIENRHAVTELTVKKACSFLFARRRKGKRKGRGEGKAQKDPLFTHSVKPPREKMKERRL